VHDIPELRGVVIPPMPTHSRHPALEGRFALMPMMTSSYAVNAEQTMEIANGLLDNDPKKVQWIAQAQVWATLYQGGAALDAADRLAGAGRCSSRASPQLRSASCG
jgi:hypothetical protein